MADGRGRLSSIDKLPASCAGDVAWAADELLANKRDQKDILAEFNERLAAHGEGPISSSAFSRHSVQLAQLTQELEETRQVTEALVARFGPENDDNLTKGTITLLKNAVFRAKANAGEIDPDTILSLSRAMQALAAAEKTSAGTRRDAQAEIDAKLKKAAKAFKAIGEEHGFSADTVAKISSQVLGV